MSEWQTFTAAGAVVVDEGTVLMVRQRRAYGVHWELPSGYYEAGESLEQTARREVLEETGVNVDVGELVCTMVWERPHDHRRNVLAFFEAEPVDAKVELRPQVEEDIDAAEWIDPIARAAEVHPLNRAILDRWWDVRRSGFHVHADVTVASDGGQSYSITA